MQPEDFRTTGRLLWNGSQTIRGVIRFMVHALFGRRVNAPLSLLLQHTARQLCGIDIGSVDAVSYTHLDVYKRQGIKRAASELYIGCGPFDSLRVFGLTAVSYTHLEVYKRQGADRA